MNEEEKYKGKYRIRSHRLKDWDYSHPGTYFVTICVRERGRNILGKLEDDIMVLNKHGQIVREEWLKTAEIRKNVVLDVFCILPDHLHGILFLQSPTDNAVETPWQGVSTGHILATRNPHHNPQWKSGSLSAIINQFKRKCTIKIRQFHPDFHWQPRFYDRIIRSEPELDRTRHYIHHNVEKHAADPSFTDL